MNWFGNMFKKKKKTYNQCEHKLLIIDDSSDIMHEILGITEERAQVLLDVCLKAYEDNNQLHLCLEQVTSECKHTNELVFAMIILHKVIDRKNSINGLMNALKNMFSHGE